jgi:hypothetical protein
MSGDMDHPNKDTSRWVYERLAALPPAAAGEGADAALAHYRSYERVARRRRRLHRGVALASLVVSILVLIAPASRGIARQLWDSFYMRTPEAVRSTLPRSERPLFFDRTTSPVTPARFVFDAPEAEQFAGFAPRIPAVLVEQLASGLAVLKVSGPLDAKVKIHVKDLKAALHRRGIEDISVPQDWEGVEVAYHIGAGIYVAFLGGIFSQALPPSVTTPPGFRVIDFTETALRAAGLSASDAHNSRNMMVDSGGAFAIVPSDAKSDFREVAMRSGHGLLFENETDEDEQQKCSLCAGPHERVLTWAAGGRIFQLRSRTMALNEVIELADSVN